SAPEFCGCQTGSPHRAVSQVSAHEQDAFQVSVTEISPAQVNALQVRIGQVRPPQVGSLEIAPCERTVFQLHPSHLRTTKIALAQIERQQYLVLIGAKICRMPQTLELAWAEIPRYVALFAPKIGVVVIPTSAFPVTQRIVGQEAELSQPF